MSRDEMWRRIRNWPTVPLAELYRRIEQELKERAAAAERPLRR